MFNFTFILIIICLILVFIKYLSINRNYWKTRNIKQVNGIIWTFVTGKRSLPEIFKEIYDAHPKLPHVGTFLGIKPTLVLRDIENIEAVLHGDFRSFYSRGLVANTSDLLADNLLFVEDFNRWKLMRQKNAPDFAISKLKNIFHAMDSSARDFIDYIDKNPQFIKNPFHAVYAYTTSCVSSSLLGIQKETQNTTKTLVSEIAYNSVKPSLKTNLKFALLNVSPTLFKLLNIKAFGEYEDLFINIMKKIMEERRNDKNDNFDFIDTCLKMEERGKLKDYVIGYETDVNIQLLAAQAFVFLLGGIESTATATHFTLLELSYNPKVLKKVHDEIDAIFKNNNDTLTFEDIDRLVYMDMVINESLRKYPPIASIQRRCRKDTVLPVGQVKIEKDTLIIIPTYALHTDEKYFPNPDEFNPDRFSKENKSKIVKFSYLPFGEGKRNCIGIKLANIEMKVGLAWLLRKYTIKEQIYTPSHTNRFEQSFFGLRDPNATYELVPRT
ncbi:cytochrome P450 6B2-like [Epargyreus clarus]|uniref:cytochrome P450 6B2-like n=1 Tax=Epargyreus clarus TaxID=520877 RepID=UPI003C2E27F0